MTQRTFNQINTSPTIFDQEETDVMEVQPTQKGKRGRKRHSDEECLTDAERVKKEKNRQAAQKCREKKEKEAKDLKNRNEELEMENKKLSDEKRKLEERARIFSRIIQEHIQKGCSLPPNVQEVYNEGKINMSSSEGSDDVELFRAVGTIERDHTPPRTPEEPSSENLSPRIPHHFRNFSGAPTALFSGTPLTEDDIVRRRSGSISRSPSSSPALPLSPAKTAPHLPGKQKDLSYFLAHDKVPRALAPISPSRIDRDDDSIAWFPPRPRQIVPTVVSEFDDDSEDTTEYISKSYDIIDREKNTYLTVQSSGVMESAFQLPDIPSEDEVAKQLTRESSITHGEEAKQNLPSLGFNCIPGYSYTEDLQQMESVQEIIDYTNDVHQDNSQVVSTGRQNSSLPRTEISETQPVVNVSVCAPALLGIGDEMSESLQQQIKTSYSSPASSAPGSLSVPEIKQCRPNKNQQNLFTHSGPVLTQENLINQTSDTSKQQLFVGEGQQLIKGCQKLMNCLETLKEGKHFTAEHDFQHSDFASERVQEILKSLLKCKSLTVQNQNSDQSLEVVPNLESCLPLRKITRVSPPNGNPSFVRRASEELPVQLGNRDQMSTGTSATGLVPVCVGVPMINVTSPRVQTLISPSSQMANLLGSSSYSASGETTDRPVTPQHHYVVKEGTRIIHVNKQLTETSSHTAQAQTLTVGPHSSVFITESNDYSEHMQDLPSLNLTELNSDNNLFEKKPSRSTS